MAKNSKYCAECGTHCQPSAIRELSGDLEEMLQHEIDMVLTEAFAAKLIGQTVKTSSGTDMEKVRRLLAAVTSRVKTDSESEPFETFLSVLRKSSSLKHLADALEKKISKIHQPETDAEQTDSTTKKSQHTAEKHKKVRADSSRSNGHTCQSESGDEEQPAPAWNHKKRVMRSKKSKSRISTDRSEATLSGPQLKSKVDNFESDTGFDTNSYSVPVDSDQDHAAVSAASDSEPHCSAQPTTTWATSTSGTHLVEDNISVSQPANTVLPQTPDYPAVDNLSPFPTEGKANIGGVDSKESIPLQFVAPMPSSDGTTSSPSKPAEDEVTESDGDEILPGGNNTQPQKASEQPQAGTTALVPGSTSSQRNENDWADQARYYVAVGANRETEKDKLIEELIEEKNNLEAKHAKNIKKLSEDHAKQVSELSKQLAEKEWKLTSVREERDKELSAAVRKLKEEKAEKQEQLKKHRSEIESLKEKNAELEREIADKSETVKVQKRELQATKAKIKKLEDQLKAKRREIDEFEQKKAKEIAAIERKFEEKISRLQLELDSEKRAAVYKEQYLDAQSKLELSKQENQHSKQAHALEIKIKELENKLSEEKANNAIKEKDAIEEKANNAIKEIEEKHEQLRVQHKQGQTDLQQVREQLEQRDKEVQELQQEVRRLSLSSRSSSEASLIVSRSATSDDQSQLHPIDESK